MSSKLTVRRYHSAPSQELAVTVSGSFHRHLHSIRAAVEELAAMSVRVLSPADPRIVAQQGEFLFVASDRVRSVKLVQDRHLESIRAASFLWLVCPDGYVGQSASLEVGFAIAASVAIFAAHAPDDLTLRQYITVVPSLSEALRIVTNGSRSRGPEGILINPHASVEEAHCVLDRIEDSLKRPSGLGDPSRRVRRDAADLQAKLELFTHIQ